MSDFESRRHFIKSASLFALTVTALPPAVACLADNSASESANTARPSRIEIADREEPGTRILIRGTILDSDGKPASNVKMFLYHTDATGYYSRPVNNPRQARLNGTLWSDERGQYEFNTIKPAHYGDVQASPPMHIHVHLEPSGLPDHWVESYYFADDPKIPAAQIAQANNLGATSNIIRLTAGKSGVLEGVRDFRIDRSLAERNRLVSGWYRN